MSHFSVPENVTLAVFEPVAGADYEFADGSVPDVDLTGVSQLVLGVAALAPIFGGGELQLRVDDPGSPPLASVKVESSLLLRAEDSWFSFDLSALDGVHTLYLGTPVTGAGDEGKPVFAIVILSFQGPGLGTATDTPF